MSMRTNAGFPDSLLTRLKNALAALTGRVQTNENAITALQNSLSTTNTNLGKKTTYDDFTVTSNTFSVRCNGNSDYGRTTVSFTNANYYPLCIAGWTLNKDLQPGQDRKASLAYIKPGTRGNGTYNCEVACAAGSSEAVWHGISGTVYVIWVRIK